MWYLLSLLGLIFLVTGLAGPGAWVVDACLPFRQRPLARRFVSPLLGLALLLVPATLLGWFGGGYRWWVCLPLTLGLIAAGRWRRAWMAPGGLRHGLTLAAFCGLASFPFLGQILVCRAFDPFNDAFFYLVQAQWLQGHGFAEIVHPSGFYPAWGQVATFQQTGLRMGPSFLLGWWQAAGGLPWSYQAYPLASTVMVVAGSLAVSGAILAAFPGRRREAWLAALIAATSANGFAAGPTLGFYPQTCGLAFAAGAVALRSLELCSPAPTVSGPLFGRLRAGFPLALLVAAVVFCYPEVFPFLAASWLASHVLSPGVPHAWQEWRVRFARVWPTAALVLVLANAEWFRFWTALQIQAHIVTGFPVAWKPWDFVGHSLGLRRPLIEVSSWIWNVRWLHLLCASPFVAGFVWWVGSRGCHRLRRVRPLLPTALLTAIFLAAFLWFRYAVANPWPEAVDGHLPGVGQSWSQFKLSAWASLSAITLAAGFLLVLAGRRTCLATGLLLGWAVAALAGSVGRLGHPTRAFRHVLGVGADPFAPLLGLRDLLAAVPKDEVVYLDFRGEDFSSLKIRELPVYFLSDRRLAGDWTADSGLLAFLLPEDEKNISIARADWVVRTSHPADGTLRFTLERLPRPPR